MQVRDLIEELKRFDERDQVTVRVLIPESFQAHNEYHQTYREIEFAPSPHPILRVEK